MRIRKFATILFKILPILGFLYYRLIYQEILFISSGWTVFSNIAAILIFGQLWLEFANRFEQAILALIKYLLSKDSRNLAKEVKIKVGYYFTCEVFLSGITFLFAFGVYHWFTSNPIIIAISSVLFKKINQDIPHLLISSLLGAVTLKHKLPHDELIKNTDRLPGNFYSCIYIPQKSDSKLEVIAGIGQGIRSYRNNLNQSKQSDHLAFIYHSDTSCKILRQRELKEILDAQKKYKKVFIFFRNQKAKNPTFLKKPGGYMSDYQILTHGIWHPVTYVSKVSDARRQVCVRRDRQGNIAEIREHIPFTALLDNNGRLIEEEDYEYYIRYRAPGKRKNLYVKENISLIKLGEVVSSQEKSFEEDILGNIRKKEKEYKPVKMETFCYLQDSENPGNYIRQVAGDLFDLKTGLLLVRSYQWQIDHRGYITSPVDGKQVETRLGGYLPKRAFQVFSQTIYLPDGKKLILDKKGYLWDYSTGKLWANPNDYKVRIIYDMYEFRNGDFYIKEKDIEVSQGNFNGEDFRRIPCDLFNGIDRKELEVLVKEGEISKEQADKIAMTGILGNIYLLHIGKNGWEEEYLVEDLNFPYPDKAKKAKESFIVNQKDGFYLTLEGELIYLGETYPCQFNPKNLLIAEKDKVKILSKERIYIDYRREQKIIKHRLLAHWGSWYKDNNGNYRKRKLLAKMELVCGFDKDLNAIVHNPILEQKRIFKAGSFFINEVGLWDAKGYPEDKVINTEGRIIKIDEWGNLVVEEVLASLGDYYIDRDGKVVIEGKKKIFLGTFLKSSDGKFLIDEEGKPLEADSGIKIANQTDCDAEFLPDTIKYLNSIAARNIQEQKFPFGMYQPEIGFGNWGESRFTKTQVWALAMYKFVARAIYRLFGQSTAYGKMTKFINLYVSNIAFKETLPPIARCHDHWEAMRLKTALVISYPKEKAKLLVENTPSNFLSFLRRQTEWIGGDLRLLEFETYLGVVLNLIRSLWTFFTPLEILDRFRNLFLRGLSKGKASASGGLFLTGFTKGISEAKYWLKLARHNVEKLKEFKKVGALPANAHHLSIVRRSIFNPFLFGIWLLLIGVISLIFPGLLSIKSPSLAWLLFFSIITVLIILPKILIPILGKILDSEKKVKTFLSLALLVSLGILCGWLGMKFFPMVWFSLTLGISLVWLGYKLVLEPLINLIFNPAQRLRNRLMWVSIIVGLYLLVIHYIIPFWQALLDIPSARWIPIFLLSILPNIFTYAVPIFIFLSLTKQGKAQIEALKRGILETVYSTSLFLMMVIFIPIILAKKLYFMLTRPNTSFAWQTHASYENDFDRLSTLKVYLYLKAPVVVSILFIILPVLVGLTNPSIIFYGWPIFILSWIFGPLVVKLTGCLGKDKYYNSLAYLGLRDKFMDKLEKLNTDTKIIKAILDMKVELKDEVFEAEMLKLYLLNLTNIEKESLKSYQDAINKLIYKEDELSYRLRERDWNSLSEIGRCEILIKLAKSKIFIHPKLELIKIVRDIILRQESQSLGVTSWKDLTKREKIKFIQKTFQKYKFLDKGRPLTECKYWTLLQPILL